MNFNKMKDIKAQILSLFFANHTIDLIKQSYLERLKNYKYNITPIID